MSAARASRADALLSARSVRLIDRGATSPSIKLVAPARLRPGLSQHVSNATQNSVQGTGGGCRVGGYPLKLELPRKPQKRRFKMDFKQRGATHHMSLPNALQGGTQPLSGVRGGSRHSHARWGQSSSAGWVSPTRDHLCLAGQRRWIRNAATRRTTMARPTSNMVRSSASMLTPSGPTLTLTVSAASPD